MRRYDIYEDQQRSCKICGETFIFNEGEQQFYKDRDLTPPKRCPECRKKRSPQEGVDNV